MWDSATESPAVNPASPDPCSLPPVPSEPVPSNQSLNPEARASALIATLEQQASEPTDLATLSDHLSLLRRWYYRPEKHRTGEVFFPKEDSAAANKETAWPIRRILNGAARIALGDPKPLAETHRDLAQRNAATPNSTAAPKPIRPKTLHAGRLDAERNVPIAPKRFRSRKSVNRDSFVEDSK